MNTARNTYETLSPLTWLLKVFSFNCNVEQQSYSKKLSFMKTLLTVLVIGCLNMFCLYYKIKYIFDTISTSIKLTDSIQMIYDHFQFIVDLWFINKYGQHISIEYFKQYESIDIILGMTDYTTIKWKLAKLLCFFTSIWFTSSALDLAAWSLGFGWLIPLVYSVSYLYLFIKILTILDLTSHVMHIEFRLTMLADFIQSYYLALENIPGFVRNSNCDKNWICLGALPRVLEPKSCVDPLKIFSKDYNEVQLLKRCYLQLTDQVKFINSMFGFRILLNSLSLLIDIVRFTNIAIRLITGTQVTQVTTYSAIYFPAVSSLLRMLTCVAVLVTLVVHCEKSYNEMERIVSIIDHLLVIKNPCEKLRTIMVELRSLVLARPICFSLAKFFKLDYSFLVSVASVTVTYTIILLQSMN